jgi:predicted phosphoribosyltransferase
MIATVATDTPLRYADHHDAGRVLARALRHLTGAADVIVLGLPRGGVPVAWEVAHAIGAPLDVFVISRMILPDHPELAFGVVATGGIRIVDRELVTGLGLSAHTVDAVTRAATADLARHERTYREGGRPLVMGGRVVVLVSDAITSGTTMRAAVLAVRTLRPRRVVVAAPVGCASACEELTAWADEVICPRVVVTRRGVAAAYADPAETRDDEVRALLGFVRVGRQGW